MQIKFKGQYDKKLFYNAVRLANQPGRTSRLMYIFVGLVFGVMAVSTISEIIKTGDFAGNIIEIALLLLLGVVLYQAYIPTYLGARRMWNTTSVQRPLSGYVTKQGITYNFPKGDKSYPWSDFNRLRKVGGLVTLITIRGMLLIFPRHFFNTETDWERFTKLIDTHVVVIKKK
ncbi:MAG: YcxB family protein [Anaerolineales bacterium]|uniref:YcxB family protein n=1 Tax=Candidatus Desulfolinea nitratireducens TaxID=2841698 RepID=A0A8J6NM83_9CHLR|nr:YcxB family protein [Candidatus Desulfolinea nitratireducens]MBL6962174.1 YcxB family protein [Anaerolineales bacterium]